MERLEKDEMGAPLVAAAVRQIDQARLTATQYRAARRLLDAAAATGHVKVTKEVAAALCFMESEGATRRLLGALQQAKIIHYSINSYVYVDFTAWSPVAKTDHPRAVLARTRAVLDHDWIDEGDDDGLTDLKMDHLRAEMARTRAVLDHGISSNGHLRSESARTRSKTARVRAESDHPRAETDRTYAHAHAHVCLSVDPISLSSSDKEEQTDKQTPEGVSTIDPIERSISFALLCAIRVWTDEAKQLSEQKTLNQVREAVCRWFFNRKSVGGEFDETPGIVVYWLKNWENAGVPPLDPRFRQTEYYRQFRTPLEIEADEQAEAEEEAQQAAWVRPAPAEATTVAEPVSELDGVWAATLAAYRVQAREIVDHQLKGTRLVAVADGRAVIEAPGRWVEWIQNRLQRRLLNELKLSGLAVTSLVVQEAQ
jgi:hypothetical protein